MMDLHVGGGNYQAASLARAMLLSKETELRLKRSVRSPAASPQKKKLAKQTAAQFGGSPSYYQKSCKLRKNSHNSK